MGLIILLAFGAFWGSVHGDHWYCGGARQLITDPCEARQRAAPKLPPARVAAPATPPEAQ